MRKILQLLPSIISGDGISNEAIQIYRILKRAGFQTHIYAERIGPGVPQDIVSVSDKMPPLEKEDILIYHLSLGSGLYSLLRRLKCHVIFRYHNITPANFFRGYLPELEKACRYGLWQFQRMSDLPDLVLAVSSYNAQHLKSLGYQCLIERLPIIVDWSEYQMKGDAHILEKYKDGYRNFLFVGRIVPNKRQEDIIKVFYAYHRWVNPMSRLILVGNCKRVWRYHQELLDYCQLLGLTEKDVIFTGCTSFPELLAYYQTADTFLCMSEHEGFCIPLLEAMFFQVPVIAYDAAAVGETLGNAGILLKNKDVKNWVNEMDKVIRDKEYRENLLKEQNERLEEYSYDLLQDRLLEILNKMF